MAYIGNTNTTQAFAPAIDYFSGNGSTVAFTLSRPVASVAQVQAVVNNVAQTPGSAYTVSGSTITFTGVPSAGTNNIYVYYTSPITQVAQPGQGTVGTTQLSATGTPSSGTFLRGDNTWATVTSLPGTQGQLFSSSGTFTIPTGISTIKVTVCGAQGGGGGRNTTSSNVGGQGAVGGVATKFLTGLTPGNTLTVTVGVGGTAGGNTSGYGNTAATGGTGGTSSVASGTQTISTVSATGGSGGTGGYTYNPCCQPVINNNGGVGTAGTGSGGDINAKQNGTYSSITGAASTGAGASGGTAAQAGQAGLIIFEW
jgi:hypothetical protein